jgi:competence protein ComEC
MRQTTLLVSITCIVFLAILAQAMHHSEPKGVLTVTFLDVGQGDTTLIESPTGTQVLIDGGRGSAVLAPLQKELGYFDRDIDIVIATHPDSDHIEGLISVLAQYTVHTIMLTENNSGTPTYNAFLHAVESEEADIIYARSGQTFSLGTGSQGSTTLTILYPYSDTSTFESNTASIVSQLRYGSSSYLFMADAPKEVEEQLLTHASITLQSTVLKAGHHGSRTSSEDAFIATVTPQYATISAGKDNSYGHPHQEVLDTLTKYHVQYRNTADIGSIHTISDGKGIWVP